MLKQEEEEASRWPVTGQRTGDQRVTVIGSDKGIIRISGQKLGRHDLK
jgi:hypothetical protein